MSALTIAQIRAAQHNDLDAVTAVITATESRITRLAYQAAQRMAQYGDRLSEYREEFEQVARVAVWEAIPRFDGETVDAFFAFIYKTVEGVLLDAVRSERNGGAGADKAAIQIFGQMLVKAGDDPYLAEKLCQTVPPKGKRLSADRANAARLAWEGTVSLNAPAPVADGYGEGDIMGALAETVATEMGMPEDLVTADDMTREADRVKHAVVNAILDVMGENQRTVIRHSFGIAGHTCYGYGDQGDDEGMSAEIGLPVVKIRDARTKGLKAFAKRYIKVAAKNAEHARELEDAAAKNLGRGGRK